MSRRVAVILAALVAAAAGWSGASANNLTADVRSDASALTGSVARSETPLAVTRAADESGAATVARIERVGLRDLAVDGASIAHNSAPVARSQPLTQLTEVTIQMRALAIGPVPGRAPPALRAIASFTRIL